MDCLSLHGLDGSVVADFLDGAGDDGGVVSGVAEFEVHAAADVLEFEHGTSPGGAGDGDLHGAGTEFGMAGDESITAAEKHGGIDVVESFDFENGGGRKIVEKNSAFDFGLDDGVIDAVGQIGVRGKHTDGDVVRSVLQIGEEGENFRSGALGPGERKSKSGLCRGGPGFALA
jgi:hypothetical protein